jgi:outer membrane protein OmpA-like peptidoglycan-associated protein
MKSTSILTLAVVIVLAAIGAAATELTLNQVTFPERKDVDLEFERGARAPQAELGAEVVYREGQAAIDVRYTEMKPAILFGGDVTCYVLWAVSRDGTVENLGELWVRDDTEKVEYSTGLKSFALMVTAESHPLVSVPSELVMFTANPPPAKRAPSETFTFSDLGPAPKTEYDSTATVLWDRKQNLDLRQAEKAVELAVDAGAEEYAASQMRRARTTLTQARNSSAQRKMKAAIDYSRRTVAFAAEAMQTTQRQKEAEALEAEIARRRAEMEALEARAHEAEEDAAAAEAALAEAERQRSAADAAVASASKDLANLEQAMSVLNEQARELRAEKEDLSERLQGALSRVAETRESARGMIVNLPDILFDLNQATLKPEAQIVLAKLAGILLIMDELNLRAEGHTDSTGSAAYNQQLSVQRATSVRDFLAANGIDMDRMVAAGYGMTRPVAENATAAGRAQNRRVEIVIAEGVVAEAEN